jgi:hypothetical protein
VLVFTFLFSTPGGEPLAKCPCVSVTFLFSTPGGDPLANIPDPVERFEDFPGVSEGLLRSFRQQGFTAPTPIQVSSIAVFVTFCLVPYKNIITIINPTYLYVALIDRL